MDNYTLTPPEMLVIAQYVILLHLLSSDCHITNSCDPYTSVFHHHFFSLGLLTSLHRLLGKHSNHPLNYEIKTVFKKSI